MKKSFMTVALFRMVAFVVLGLVANPSWAAELCHIHPAGTELKEPDPQSAQFYGSLEECEAASNQYYAGAGQCHCFPDLFSGRGDFDLYRRPPEKLDGREKRYAP
jgi:hypothetical protein